MNGVKVHLTGTHFHFDAFVEFCRNMKKNYLKTNYLFCLSKIHFLSFIALYCFIDALLCAANAIDVALLRTANALMAELVDALGLSPDD